MDIESENYQTIRINGSQKSEAQAKYIKENLKSILGDTLYAVNCEWAKIKGWHCHAVFYAPDFNKEDFKKSLYDFMARVPEHDVSKIGNGVWQNSTCQSLDNAITYLWKFDKNVYYDGTPEWKAYVLSKKNEAYTIPTSIKELMGDLYTAFENDELTERQLWVNMVVGRAQFPDSKTRYGDIDAFVETFKIKKFGEQYANDIWENRNIRLT